MISSLYPHLENHKRKRRQWRLPRDEGHGADKAKTGKLVKAALMDSEESASSLHMMGLMIPPDKGSTWSENEEDIQGKPQEQWEQQRQPLPPRDPRVLHISQPPPQLSGARW